jgi:hypothetical protein
MKLAYADPPYIGCGHRYPEKREVDHEALIRRLEIDFPDGWALSCSATSLPHILSLMPWFLPMQNSRNRIGVWVKPFAVFKPNVNPAYAWEPVIFVGGRKRTRQQPTLRDWHSENITLRKGLVGAKPPKFCVWLFEMLGAEPDDEFHDLFPGTGGVTKAWKEWCDSKLISSAANTEAD